MKTSDEMFRNVMRRRDQHQAAQKAKRRWLGGVAALCCLCLVMAAFFVLGGQKASDPALSAPETTQSLLQQTPEAPSAAPETLFYHILIDVNPSICLTANEADLVTAAEALNADGEEILAQAQVEGLPVEDAMKEVANVLVDMGYISEEANSILVSVEGARESMEGQIKDQIADGIRESLDGHQMEGAIIVQTVAQDSALAQLADAHGISIGKAQLIEQILAQNPFLTFEELAVMKIHELNLLKVSYYIQLENAQQEGQPGAMAYIGEEQASQIAVSDAAVAAEGLEVQLDCRAGRMVYCVSFQDAAYSYRYYINAVTGEILSADKISQDTENFPQTETDNSFLGENAALEAAIAHAGLTGKTITWCKQDRDWVNGTVVYNLFFTDGRLSGRYVVDARSGQILQSSLTQEPRDRSVSAAVIGHAAAKQIALAKDGLVDGNVSKYELKLQQENGSDVYEINWICNGVKYYARLSAAEGNVLHFEKDGLVETGAPSVETGENTSAEGNPASAPETGANAPEEGSRPSAEEGNRPSAEEGDRPSPEEENRPSAEDGSHISGEN